MQVDETADLVAAIIETAMKVGPANAKNWQDTHPYDLVMTTLGATRRVERLTVGLGA